MTLALSEAEMMEGQRALEAVKALTIPRHERAPARPLIVVMLSATSIPNYANLCKIVAEFLDSLLIDWWHHGHTNFLR